jgi:hypothetical protein
MARSIKRLIAALLLLLAPLTGASAEDSLWIRMIEASNDGQEISPAVRDLVPLLRDNLPFKQYKLLDQNTTRLPASGEVKLAEGFKLRLFGVADNLQVTLEKDGKVMIQTVLSLRKGRPVILGGFPRGAGGKLLLVLIVK